MSTLALPSIVTVKVLSEEVTAVPYTGLLLSCGDYLSLLESVIDDFNFVVASKDYKRVCD